VVLTGCIVAMATCYAKKMTIICSPMIGHLFDAIAVLSTGKEWTIGIGYKSSIMQVARSLLQNKRVYMNIEK